MKILGLVVRLVSGFLVVAPALAADDAAGILLESASAYANLRTYTDAGVVSTRGGFGDLTFDTAFERPEHLRFAFKDGHPFWLLRFLTIEHIVRDDAQRVTTWTYSSNNDPVEKVNASLALAVAGATGVSRASAHHIATLLMPHLWDAEPFGSSVLALGKPRLMSDETIDGVPCRHVAGLAKSGRSVDVWIARSDHLVRRIDTHYDDGMVDSEWRRDVRIDAPVRPGEFDTRVAPRRIGERAPS